MSYNLVFSKIQEKGFLWLFYKSFKVIARSLLKFINIFFIYEKILINFNKNKNVPSEILYAFYDLSVSPSTFDIIKFLLLSESYRVELGCGKMHIVIVPGNDNGFRREKNKNYSFEHNKWRLRNLLEPCCWLIPSVCGVTILALRSEARMIKSMAGINIYPKNYSIYLPESRYGLDDIISFATKGAQIPSIRPTPEAIEFVTDWIKNKIGTRKVITITLRECSYETDRNSNIVEWSKFIKNLNQKEFCPVILRDIEKYSIPVPIELKDAVLFSEAIWNIELRAAIYELSYINLFVNCGPLALCIYNKFACSLRFKMLVPSSSSASELFFYSSGLKPGSQMRFLSPFHRIVWQEDKYEVIAGEFRKMCKKIEQHENDQRI
jgi:hypothetical protein